MGHAAAARACPHGAAHWPACCVTHLGPADGTWLGQPPVADTLPVTCPEAPPCINTFPQHDIKVQQLCQMATPEKATCWLQLLMCSNKEQPRPCAFA